MPIRGMGMQRETVRVAAPDRPGTTKAAAGWYAPHEFHAGAGQARPTAAVPVATLKFWGRCNGHRITVLGSYGPLVTAAPRRRSGRALSGAE